MTLPAIPESIYAAAWRRWLQSGEDDCRPLLAECLDAVWPDLHALAAASLPADTPWQPIGPGTVIKAGTRYRIEWFDEGGISAMERTDANDIAVDPRTVPADPDAALVEAMARAQWAADGDERPLPEGSRGDAWRAEARAALAAIRETHTIEPKPTTGPLGGAR